MCYPCKQFVVVTKRRTGSWNTIPTLPYLTLLTFFSSDSDKIYRDSSSIHRLVSRKNDYSGRQNSPPSEQISNLSENSLESITIQSSSASTVAALLEDIHSGGGCLLLSEKRRPNQTEYINLQGGSSLFFYDQQLAFLAPIPINTKKKKKKKKRKKKTQKTTTTTTSKP